LWKNGQRGKKWPQSYFREREHHKARPGFLLQRFKAL